MSSPPIVPLSLSLFLCLIISVRSVPPPQQFYLPSLTRVAVYEDIPASYGSIYKATSNCPDTLTIGTPTIDARQVALVDVSTMSENGQQCTGDESMAMVSEATVEQDGLLTALQLSGFQENLDANTNAANLVATSDETSMLVGWHSSSRDCAGSTYPSSTIYFIIREPKAFRISFKVGNQTDTVTIPPLLKGLLIVSQNSTVCLLVDRLSNTDSDAVLSSELDGSVSSSVLVPFGEPAAPQAPPAAPSATPVAPVAQASLPPPPFPSNTATPEKPIQEDMPEESFEELEATPVVPDISQTAESQSEQQEPRPGAAGGPPQEDVRPETSVEDDGSACFPADAVVTLGTGEKVAISSLSVGDKVVSGNGSVSDVMFFTHRESGSKNRFLRFETTIGESLIVSPGHYLIGGDGDLVAAERLDVGDELVHVGVGKVGILKVSRVERNGLYNPQTLSGEIVVNGFKCSTYTTAVEPQLAHTALLVPVRFLYGVSIGATEWLSGWFEHGSAGLVEVLPSGGGGSGWGGVRMV